MKVLVTGGSGFIGSHVVDKLCDKGIQVRVYDGAIPNRSDVEFYQGSILDSNALSFSMRNIDAVMHLAAVADVKDVYEEPHYSEAINVRGTINVLEAAKKQTSVKKIIYGSTIWVYSECAEDTIDETTPLHAPEHLYTATKLAGEYYCQSYSKLYGLETTILRYGIPYGPRARDGAVIPIFVRKAFNGESLTIAGDGSQYRKFIYVEDLAEGNVLALQSVAKNKTYNLEGMEKVTIKQIAETIQKFIGNTKIEYTPERPGDFSGKEISCKRAMQELGWKPKITFEEGLHRYIEWYKETEINRKKNWESLDEILKKHNEG